MLKEIREEEERFEQVVERANAIAKILRGMEAADALYSLSLATGSVLEEAVPPSEWLAAMAGFHSAVAVSLEPTDNAEHGTEH
jgi:hypothetical protein